MFLPPAAAGDPVGDLLGGLGLGGGGGGGALPVQQQNGTGYQPPLHGGNPHGQGTAATVDILPSRDLPYSGDPDGFEGDEPMGAPEDLENGEEVVVGRSRGEQNNPYHGHVTVLALFGQEFAGVDTNEGESEEFNPLNQLVLDAICSGSGGLICLGVLNAESQTSSTGSQNHFSAVSLSGGGAIDSRSGRLGVAVLESNGNIEQDSSCQRAHGDSQVLHVGGGLDSRELSVSVLGSSADSEACNNGTSSQTNDSHLLEINGEGVFPFCEGEELINVFVFALACNADDTNGVGEAVQQAPVPYGVREALSVFVLPFFDNGDVRVDGEDGPLALLKGTVSASESHAVAPPAPGVAAPAQQPAPALQGQGAPAGQAKAGGPGAEAGPAAAEAQPGDGGRLAFTGVDVILVILMGLGLLGGGLAIAGVARSRQVI
ncbi:MAG: hypothetical protein ACRDL6_00355 [Solirubrobacterales bacterium]